MTLLSYIISSKFSDAISLSHPPYSRLFIHSPSLFLSCSRSVSLSFSPALFLAPSRECRRVGITKLVLVARRSTQESGHSYQTDLHTLSRLANAVITPLIKPLLTIWLYRHRREREREREREKGWGRKFPSPCCACISTCHFFFRTHFIYPCIFFLIQGHSE